MTLISKLVRLKQRITTTLGSALYMWRNYDEITRSFEAQMANETCELAEGRVLEADYVSLDGGYVLMMDGDVFPIVALYDGNGHLSSRRKATHAAVQLQDKRIAFSISDCSHRLH